MEGKPPAANVGVSFGVPWPRGTVQRTDGYALRSPDGQTFPLQSWPLAYWPDGSVKWTGFATVAGPTAAGSLTLASGAAAPSPKSATVRVSHTNTTVEVDTGRFRCRIPNWGDDLVDSIEVDGREVARQGRLVCIVQDGPDQGPAEVAPREKFLGRVEKVTVEQSGPVRAVVKIEGRHWAERGGRLWLPFVVRLYFYAGSDAIRVVHTIIYDGDQERDFIRGLGITFGVPLREQVQNRDVRFSGEGNGLWSEPVEPLIGRRERMARYPQLDSSGQPKDLFPDSEEGRRTPDRDQLDPRSRQLLIDWADWDDYKLSQPNADGFTIVKRTNPRSTWIGAGAGKRASGLAYVGDVSGGLSVSLRNFWQSYPSALEVHGATRPEAELTAWLWSPDGPAMDMRHYDTRAHGLDAVYEDVQEGLSTATGVARTSELTLFVHDKVPTKAESAQEAATGSVPPLLAASPGEIHTTGVFGAWDLPDRSTPFRRYVEDQLDAVVSIYEREVEQRHWYGFWYYGNIMHSYDDVRHVWRYDLGGNAWDNTELASDMWLWYSFLRTGRADIFRMAEAMARNSSEVDVYHLGPLAGLGSRHNVVPWGCGAKEARISQAAFRRFYYYLTTDERIGDIMHEVVNVDRKVVELDPMRLAQPPNAREKQYPGRVRLGPDWFAFVGNWMTEWERTGDTRWRDKIYAGIDSLVHMPFGVRSGRNLVFGYDPATSRLYPVSDELGDYNLATIQGGAEVIFELNELIDRPDWQKAWLQYCRLELAPTKVIRQDLASGNQGLDGSFAGPGRLAAYAAAKTGNQAFANEAAVSLFEDLHGFPREAYVTRPVAGPDVLNPIEESPGISTNTVAQSSLAAIEVLSLCGARLPADIPPPRTGAHVDPLKGTREGGSAGDERTPGG